MPILEIVAAVWIIVAEGYILSLRRQVKVQRELIRALGEVIDDEWA